MKDKNDIVQRLLDHINNDPDLKKKLTDKVRLEFSVLDTIHFYLQDRQEYNQGHLEEFGEFCVKETLKRGSYMPANMLYHDWLEYTEKEKERLKKVLK